MDTDADGWVTEQEFMEFLETAHREKRAKKKGTGDKWLHAFLHTFDFNLRNRGITTITFSSAVEDDDPSRIGPTDEMLQIAQKLFDGMAALCPEVDGITKPDLIACHGGDFKDAQPYVVLAPHVSLTTVRTLCFTALRKSEPGGGNFRGAVAAIHRSNSPKEVKQESSRQMARSVSSLFHAAPHLNPALTVGLLLDR